jgi:hypothetical protein
VIRQNARLPNYVIPISAFLPQPQPPPPAEFQPSNSINATSFLAREANRVAWRRRSAHLM